MKNYITTFLLFSLLSFGAYLTMKKETPTPLGGQPLINQSLPAMSSKREIIEARSTSTKSFLQDNGETLTVFSTAPLHYKVADEWKDIDLTLVDKGTYYGVAGYNIDIRIPKTSDGDFNSTMEGKGVRTKFLNVSAVQSEIKNDWANGNQAIYKEVYPGVDMVVYPRWWGVQRDFIVKSATSTDSIQFESEGIGLSNGTFASTSQKVMTYKDVNKENVILRGFDTKDKTGKKEKIFTSKNTKNGVNIFTIKTGFSENAKYPVTIDPDDFFPTAGNNSPLDGYYGCDECNAPDDWAKERTALSGDTNNTTGTTARCLASLLPSGADWWVSRCVANFATGTTLNGKTITSATLSVWVVAKFDGNGTQAYANVGHFTGSASTLTVGDYDMFDGLDQVNNTAAITKQASDIDLTGISTSATTTFTLNATGLTNINQTGGGITGFGVLIGYDIENIEPAISNNEIEIGMADGNRPPLLQVTTAAVGGGFPENRKGWFQILFHNIIHNV